MFIVLLLIFNAYDPLIFKFVERLLIVLTLISPDEITIPPSPTVKSPVGKEQPVSYHLKHSRVSFVFTFLNDNIKDAKLTSILPIPNISILYRF